MFHVYILQCIPKPEEFHAGFIDFAQATADKSAGTPVSGGRRLPAVVRT